MQLLGVEMSRSPLFACEKDIEITQSCPREGILLHHSLDVHLESIKSANIEMLVLVLVLVQL